jgi:hypothetical protein
VAIAIQFMMDGLGEGLPGLLGAAATAPAAQ